MSSMKTLLQIFTWWNGSTIGTRFHTWRHGKRVGEDAMGNVYYEGKGRRWVQYAGLAEASAIPAGWHGWMHYRTDTAPSQEKYEAREWELPHQANPTGTPAAYHPKGAMGNRGGRPQVTGDYEAWRP